MKKTIALLAKNFDSSSSLTPQFAEFFRMFKKEFTVLVKEIGGTDIRFSRGHFEVFGFFTAKTGQIYYFSLSDVRVFKSFMYRTANSYKDWTGGFNQNVKIGPNMFDNITKNWFTIEN